jgi:hypothetical protein
MMLMLTPEELAVSLLSRMNAILGHTAKIKQVDFVACEDDLSIMAYIYAADGDCTPLVFDRQVCFDPGETERLMIAGVVPVRLH